MNIGGTLCATTAEEDLFLLTGLGLHSRRLTLRGHKIALT